MSEFQSDREEAARKLGPLKWVIGAVLLIGVAAVLYVIAQASFKPAGVVDLKEFKKASLEKLDVPAQPRAAPATVFTDGAGKELTLADFKGQVVVMNLWATWCAPCKKEMPTLGKLQAAYATQPLKVLPIELPRSVPPATASAVWNAPARKPGPEASCKCRLERPRQEAGA